MLFCWLIRCDVVNCSATSFTLQYFFVKYMEIFEKIKEERIRLGLTQAELALAIGATRRSVINWECGDAQPPAQILASMDAHGIDVLYVLTGRRSAPIESTLDRRGQALVDNYINSPEEGKRVIESTALFATKQVGRKTGT